jgi:heme oxygenase (biliverdin-IX-beta and delta-forming)
MWGGIVVKSGAQFKATTREASMTDANDRDHPGAAARRLIRGTQTAHFGTLMAETGHPYVSLVNVATDPVGTPILLLSALAWHTKNIERDRRASTLFVAARPAGQEDALQGLRVTVLGAMVRAPASERRRFLAQHPQAADYCDFADFGFWRLEPEQVHAVAGFGRIMTFAADEVFEPQRAAAIAAIEEEALDHMNRDHGDAVQLYATALAGRARGGWRMAALDEDGFTLVDGAQSARIAFDRPVRNAAELRATLAEMAERARLASVC